MELTKRGRCLLTTKIVFGVLGAVSGISIFVSFSYYNNWHAAAWGLLSAIFAIMVLRLHIFRRRNTLHLRYNAETMRIAKQCGIFTSLISFIAAITYFVLAYTINHGYQLENDGYMPAGIFALMTLKWTVMLFLAGKKYEEFLSSPEQQEFAYTNTSNQAYSRQI
ncbi:uncharacterized protein LOC129224569 [Uloborus diversus]|uniref:uncharacterized protein LOC129224569 n=1 Tax=Uloborus diversus TaxID=327109 RepID=UPI00240A02B6|nr:uncharacterized protein LOC129224569 [Uloborus diversus]